MGTFSASVKGFSAKARRNIDLVVKASAQDVGELMTRRADGVTVGGDFRQGFVPVVTGELIGSVVVEIGGTLAAQGTIAGGASSPPDFAAALIGQEGGEPILMAFTAPYARRIEYGWGSAQGRFMVRNAVQQWDAIVQANAALFRD